MYLIFLLVTFVKEWLSTVKSLRVKVPRKEKDQFEREDRLQIPNFKEDTAKQSCSIDAYDLL